MSYSGIPQEEVRKIISEIQGHENHPKISYVPGIWGNHVIDLEGDFTVEQLEAIVQLMKRTQA